MSDVEQYTEKAMTNEKHLGANHVEDVDTERRHSTADEIVDLSGIEATAASSAAWLIAITVSIGNFLFGQSPPSSLASHLTDSTAGYDTGYISSVLVTIGTALGHELSSSEQELVTSLTSGGALVGAVGAGLTADRFGRKTPIWAACVVFVIGTVIQTAAYHVPTFAVGRFIVGLGVGSAAMVVPLYSKSEAFSGERRAWKMLTDEQSVNLPLRSTAAG